ncbi:hypothetical protein CPB86DRAFT_818905 [Serendipita vermifera]|nr:hypothetical protein CPB86DRAFT_818905 [Serendipita vermifera]
MFGPVHLSTVKIFTPSPHIANLRETSPTTRVVWLIIFALWAEIYAPRFFEDAFEDSIIVILLHLLCGWARSILKSITQIVTLITFNFLFLLIHPSLKNYEPSPLFLARDSNFGWSVGVALALFTWRRHVRKWANTSFWILSNGVVVVFPLLRTPNYLQPESSPTFRPKPRRPFPRPNTSRPKVNGIKSIYSNKTSSFVSHQPLVKELNTSPIKREPLSNSNKYHRSFPTTSPVRPAITPIKAPARIDSGEKIEITTLHRPNVSENCTSLSTSALKTSFTTPKPLPIPSKPISPKTIPCKGKPRKAGKAPSEYGHKKFMKGNASPKQLTPIERTEEVDPFAPKPFEPKAIRSAYLDDLAEMTAFLERNVPVHSQVPEFNSLEYKSLFTDDYDVSNHDYNKIQPGGFNEEVSRAPSLEAAIQLPKLNLQSVKLDQISSTTSSSYAPFALSKPIVSSLFSDEPAIVAKSGKFTTKNPVKQVPASTSASLQTPPDWSTQIPKVQEIHDHEMMDAFIAEYNFMNSTILNTDNSINDDNDAEMVNDYTSITPQYVAASHSPLLNEIYQPEVTLSNRHGDITVISFQDAICNGDLEMGDGNECMAVVHEEPSMDLSTPMSTPPITANIPLEMSALDSSTPMSPSPLSPVVGVSPEPPILDAYVPVASPSLAVNFSVPSSSLDNPHPIITHPSLFNIVPPETSTLGVPTPIETPLPIPLDAPSDAPTPLQIDPPSGSSVLDLFADLVLKREISKTTSEPVDDSVLSAPISETNSIDSAHGFHPEASNVQPEFSPSIVPPETPAEVPQADKPEGDSAEMVDAESFLHFLEQFIAPNNSSENDLATKVSFDYTQEPVSLHVLPPQNDPEESNHNAIVSLPLAPSSAVPNLEVDPSSNSRDNTRQSDIIPIYPNNIIPVDDDVPSTMGVNSLGRSTSINPGAMYITNPTLQPSSIFSTMSSGDEVKIIPNSSDSQRSLAANSPAANKDHLQNTMPVGIEAPSTPTISQGPSIVSNAVASTSGSSENTTPTNSSSTRNILPLPKPRNGGIFRGGSNDTQQSGGSSSKSAGTSSPNTVPSTSNPLLRSRSRIGPSPLWQSVTAKNDEEEEEDYQALMKEKGIRPSFDYL